MLQNTFDLDFILLLRHVLCKDRAINYVTLIKRDVLLPKEGQADRS
jgi:hypothetical protein